MSDDAARQEAEPTEAQVEAAAASLYRTKILGEWGLDEAHWHAWGDAGDRIMREHIAPHWREHARAALAAAQAAQPVVVQPVVETDEREALAEQIWRAAFHPPEGAVWSRTGVVVSVGGRCRAAADAILAAGFRRSQPAPVVVTAEQVIATVRAKLEEEIAHAEANGFRIEHHGGPGVHSDAVPVQYIRAALEGADRGCAG